MFLGLLPAYLTFSLSKNVLSIEPAVWKALILWLLLVTGVATLALFVWWVVSLIGRKSPTPESIWDEVIRDIEQEKMQSGPSRPDGLKQAAAKR